MTAEELHRKIYQKGLVENWARFTVERFEKKIDKFKINRTGDLVKSLKHSRTPNSVKFQFLYYGRFVDMGVGRGQKIGQTKENRSVHARALGMRSHRGPKKWYSPTMSGQVKKLAELMASEFGREAATFVQKNISIPFTIEL
jgi:hypothetical protein